MNRQAVLGIGNILMADDGIGVRVVQKLEETGRLPDVDLVDGGTSTLDMLDLFLTNDRIVVVDSLRGGHPPGTIYRLTPAQLGDYRSSDVSLHDVQVLDLIQMAALMGKRPEVVVIGIEPKEIKESLDLSPEMEDRLQAVIELVVKEVQ